MYELKVSRTALSQVASAQQKVQQHLMALYLKGKMTKISPFRLKY